MKNKRHLHSKRYYNYLCEKADYINECFKYEGSRDKAVVIYNKDFGFEIVILSYKKSEDRYEIQ